LSDLVAFALLAALLTITPGLDTLLVLRASAAGGARAGIAAAIGIAGGCLAWAASSAIGMTALLAASRVAFDALRLAGMGYLLWLGFRALFRPMPGVSQRPSDANEELGVGTEPPALSVVQALRTGLTTNLLNPKIGVFYLSVLPQFLPEGMHPLAGSLLLAMIHNIESLAWLSILALVVRRARGFLTRPSVRRRFEQVTGVVLIGFGVRLAIDAAWR
jgi:threonine/homoserine/homoserine lactone efflux protein